MQSSEAKKKKQGWEVGVKITKEEFYLDSLWAEEERESLQRSSMVLQSLVIAFSWQKFFNSSGLLVPRHGPEKQKYTY